jgi:hypothetical protein
MCYGSDCKWEIVSGPNAGECRRPPGRKGVCDEEDNEDYDETPEDDYDPYDPYDIEYDR